MIKKKKLRVVVAVLRVASCCGGREPESVLDHPLAVVPATVARLVVRQSVFGSKSLRRAFKILIISSSD